MNVFAVENPRGTWTHRLGRQEELWADDASSTVAWEVPDGTGQQRAHEKDEVPTYR